MSLGDIYDSYGTLIETLTADDVAALLAAVLDDVEDSFARRVVAVAISRLRFGNPRTMISARAHLLAFVNTSAARPVIERAGIFSSGDITTTRPVVEIGSIPGNDYDAAHNMLTGWLAEPNCPFKWVRPLLQ